MLFTCYAQRKWHNLHTASGPILGIVPGVISVYICTVGNLMLQCTDELAKCLINRTQYNTMFFQSGFLRRHQFEIFCKHLHDGVVTSVIFQAAFYVFKIVWSSIKMKDSYHLNEGFIPHICNA